MFVVVGSLPRLECRSYVDIHWEQLTRTKNSVTLRFCVESAINKYRLLMLGRTCNCALLQHKSRLLNEGSLSHE